MFIYCCIRLEDKILKTSDIEYINKFYEKYPCFEKNGLHTNKFSQLSRIYFKILQNNYFFSKNP